MIWDFIIDFLGYSVILALCIYGLCWVWLFWGEGWWDDLVYWWKYKR